jgi:hypothetical protein
MPQGIRRFVADFLAKENIPPVTPPREDPARAGEHYAVRFEAPDAGRVEVAWFRL